MAIGPRRIALPLLLQQAFVILTQPALATVQRILLGGCVGTSLNEVC